jgi:hypothetical protein
VKPGKIKALTVTLNKLRYEEYCLLGCNAMYFRESPCFRGKLPQSSGLKRNPQKQAASFLSLSAGFLLCLLYDHEDGGSTLL